MLGPSPRRLRGTVPGLLVGGGGHVKGRQDEAHGIGKEKLMVLLLSVHQSRLAREEQKELWERRDQVSETAGHRPGRDGRTRGKPKTSEETEEHEGKEGPA